MTLKLPELREIAPEYFALNERLQELRAEIERKSRRGSELTALALKQGKFAAPPVFKEQQAPTVMSPRETAAREMLGEHAPPPVPPASFVVDPLREELAAIVDELATLQHAVDLIMTPPATGGRSVWQKALIEASRKYCEAVAPSYKPIAERYARALVELGEAINAHSEFTHGLQSRGVMWAGLRPAQIIAPPPHLRTGVLHEAVDWSVKNGHLPADAMPDTWLKPTPELRKAAEHQHFDGFRTSL